MKLKTSYFNTTVFKKDLTRFAPVWALYTVLLLLFIFLSNSDSSPQAFGSYIPELIPGFVVLNLFYAPISALMVYGDLFKSRMCNALHAMPLRREGWFFTHTAAGLLFSFGPNLIAALVASLILKQYFYLALIWVVAVTAQYLFFFALCAFCIQCSGNRLAATAMYTLLNFISWLVYWLAQIFYMPHLYGLTLDGTAFNLLCPTARISQLEFIQFYNDKILGGVWNGFVAGSWIYLAVLTVVALGLLAVSLVLYRRRQLERAGDFLILKPAQLLFLFFGTALSGAVLYAIALETGDGLEYIFLGIGLAIGYFVGMMLLRRNLRVFSGKYWLGLLALAGCFALSIGLARIDPLGITRYIPDAENVRSVQIYTSSDSYYFTRNPDRQLRYTDKEDIETILQLHQLAVDNPMDISTPTAYMCDLQINYELNDGTTVSRYYELPRQELLAQKLNELLSSPEYILQSWDWEAQAEKFNLSIINYWGDGELKGENFEFWITEPEELKGLMEAIYQDCLEGNMAQHWYMHQGSENIAEVWLGVPSETKGGYNFERDGQIHYSSRYRTLNIYEDARHTLAYLKALYEKAIEEKLEGKEEPTLEDTIAGVESYPIDLENLTP